MIEAANIELYFDHFTSGSKLKKDQINPTGKTNWTGPTKSDKIVSAKNSFKSKPIHQTKQTEQNKTTTKRYFFNNHI